MSREIRWVGLSGYGFVWEDLLFSFFGEKLLSECHQQLWLGASYLLFIVHPNQYLFHAYFMLVTPRKLFQRLTNSFISFFKVNNNSNYGSRLGKFAPLWEFMGLWVFRVSVLRTASFLKSGKSDLSYSQNINSFGIWARVGKRLHSWSEVMLSSSQG